MNVKLGLGCAMVAVTLAGCHNGSSATVGDNGGTATPTKPPVAKLEMDDVKVGTGATAAVGDIVVMEYTGKLGDDTQFDSNVPADPQNPDKPPFAFQLSPGKAQVIDGWNKGIVGMKVGGERKLSIPWTMAYGEAGKPPQIPPKADLFFDVKLLGVVKHGQESDYAVTDVKKGTGPVVKKGDWVTITYTAKLLNNMLVDDSKDGTLQFQAVTGDMGGGNQVAIKGVVYGVQGMQAGGERILICPPLLSMNPAARNEKLTPTSVVKFDVKLLRVLDHQGPTMKAPK